MRCGDVTDWVPYISQDSLNLRVLYRSASLLLRNCKSLWVCGFARTCSSSAATGYLFEVEWEVVLDVSALVSGEAVADKGLWLAHQTGLLKASLSSQAWPSGNYGKFHFPSTTWERIINPVGCDHMLRKEATKQFSEERSHGKIVGISCTCIVRREKTLQRWNHAMYYGKYCCFVEILVTSASHVPRNTDVSDSRR